MARLPTPGSARCTCLLAAAWALSHAQAQTPAPPAPGASAPAAGSPTQRLEPITVRGRRLQDAGPLPGLAVSVDQLPANVQSVTAEQLRASGALNLSDYANGRLQGVSINDYSGNPFQQSLNFRGFTASPEIGTPQGLSVFFDGVRVNEPFGDVVNWDLIPVNAIDRFDLFPGSNPVFGLNTLGGAISVRSKSGFTAPGFEGSLMLGAWKRWQLQLSAGVHGDDLAGFAALTVFDEGGWRDNSPSRVGQLFGRGDWALDRGTLTASVLAADNALIGNGMVPIEDFQRRAESVFTAPDQTRNRVLQAVLAAAFDLTDTLNVTARAYRRQSQRRGVAGDIYEDFQDFGSRVRVVDWRPVPNRLPICQFAALPGGGIDPSRPLNGPQGVNCELVRYAPSPNFNQRRNGGFLDGRGQQEPGVADAGTPTGLINRTALNQVSDGLGLQLNWNLRQHKAMLGVSIDRNRADYLQSQRLGLIDAQRNVYADPDNIAYPFVAAFTDVIGNQFDGRQRTDSVYLSDVWSPQDNLHITMSGRYNRTRVQTNIGARVRFFSDLDDVDGSLPAYIVCPSPDPASCPDERVPVFDERTTRLEAVKERADYRAFNPSLGVNWLPTPMLNLFGNLSRGARVPSVIELGCALDLTPTPVLPDLPDSPLAPRSLLGSACTLPTTLSGDPYLPQIRSNSGELGARGELGAHWKWNLSLYRTDLRDDIYLVGAGSSRTYFDTIGRTRREGVEFGVQGRHGPLDLSASYFHVDATFRSRFYMLSPHNSSADFDQNSRSFGGDVSFFDDGRPNLLPSESAFLNRGLGTFRNILVEPGARMPGVPAHNLNLTVGWQATPSVHLGVSMIARSRAFMRGNDNNQHRSGGSDQQIGQYFCGGGGGLAECLGTGGFIDQSPVPVGRPFTRVGTVPGHTVFNLTARWRYAKGGELTLQVSNLFNRRYVTAGRLGLNPFAPSAVGATDASGWNYNASEWVNTSFVGPGAPRAVFLTLQHAFELE